MANIYGLDQDFVESSQCVPTPLSSTPGFAFHCFFSEDDEAYPMLLCARGSDMHEDFQQHKFADSRARHRKLQSAVLVCCRVLPQYDYRKDQYGAWSWSVTFHATFFNRMNFRGFPLKDTQELFIQVAPEHTFNTPCLRLLSTISVGAHLFPPTNSG